MLVNHPLLPHLVFLLNHLAIFACIIKGLCVIISIFRIPPCTFEEKTTSDKQLYLQYTSFIILILVIYKKKVWEISKIRIICINCIEKDISTRLTKAWTAIDRLSIIWRSDLTDKMKCSFLQAAVVLILLYGCTTWMLTKWLEKKLDGNYTKMLRAILNKSWRQHPTRHQLYGNLSSIMKTIQVRQTRHAGHC